MLKASRPTRTIALLSGPTASVTSLVGKHQRILTDPRKKQHEKMNEILVDSSPHNNKNARTDAHKNNARSGAIAHVLTNRDGRSLESHFSTHYGPEHWR